MSIEPKKLKRDAIVEALLEVRFDCEEARDFPELAVGQLGRIDIWAADEKVRLPTAAMPDEVRAQNPALAFLPWMEFRQATGGRTVRIGRNVISYHRLPPYPGWDKFKPELEAMVTSVSKALTDFKATRLGLRYVNIFSKESHGISEVNEFDVAASVGGAKLVGPVNLNYRVKSSDIHQVQIRIASPEFVNGPPDVVVNALVDMDVFTPDNWETSDLSAIGEWLEQAHSFEKAEFFKLFTAKMREELVEA